MFMKYPQLERLGTDGVNFLISYVFRRPDGTYVKVWYDEDMFDEIETEPDTPDSEEA